MFLKGIILAYLSLFMASCDMNKEKTSSILIDKDAIKKEKFTKLI